jgi:tetratricopeptide (TPR) repeat protein
MLKTKYAIFLCLIVLFALTSCYAEPKVNVASGNKYFTQGKYEQALKIYEEAIGQGVASFDVLFNVGWIYYYEQKDYQKAERIFNKALSIYPNNDILHSTLSQLYFDMNKLAEAVIEYKTAVNFAKGRIITINANKARQLLKQQGKSEQEIVSFFEEIIELNPRDYFALNVLADYDRKQGKFEDALNKYNSIVTLDPGMKEALLIDMSMCYYNLSEYKKSLLLLKEAKQSGSYVPEEMFNDVKEKAESQL